MREETSAHCPLLSHLLSLSKAINLDLVHLGPSSSSHPVSPMDWKSPAPSKDALSPYPLALSQAPFLGTVCLGRCKHLPKLPLMPAESSPLGISHTSQGGAECKLSSSEAFCPRVTCFNSGGAWVWPLLFPQSSLFEKHLHEKKRTTWLLGMKRFPCGRSTDIVLPSETSRGVGLRGTF